MSRRRPRASRLMHLETLRAFGQWRPSSSRAGHRRPGRLSRGGFCCFCCPGLAGATVLFWPDCFQQPVSSGVTQLPRRRDVFSKQPDSTGCEDFHGACTPSGFFFFFLFFFPTCKRMGMSILMNNSRVSVCKPAGL